jgi:FixJ family two-component response regulator
MLDNPVICLADSCCIVRDTMSKLLARRGFIVHSFTSGESLVQHFIKLRQTQERAEIVVLTEYRLTGRMDGIQAAQMIKDMYPRVGVIMFTINKFMHQSSAVDRLLIKPASVTELEDAIILTYVDSWLKSEQIDARNARRRSSTVALN